MFTAVVSEVPVVVIDHGDARAHEAGDGEDGDAGAEREGGVGVAEIIEVAQRLDRSRFLSGLPVAAAVAAEVDPTA
jgi:hypothetical protein